MTREQHDLAGAAPERLSRRRKRWRGIGITAAAVVAVVAAVTAVMLSSAPDKSDGSGVPAAYGGPTVHARLVGPADVAVDAAGNLYIADYGSHRVRRVGTDGRITTVAGTGEAGSAGDGRPAAQAQLDKPAGVAVDGVGNLYLTDYVNGRLRRVGADGWITTVID